MLGRSRHCDFLQIQKRDRDELELEVERVGLIRCQLQEREQEVIGRVSEHTRSRLETFLATLMEARSGLFDMALGGWWLVPLDDLTLLPEPEATCRGGCADAVAVVPVSCPDELIPTELRRPSPEDSAA